MLSATLDNLLNRGLPRSPRARQLCAQLEGRSIALEIRAITRLRVASTGQTLAVTRDDAPADATLTGGPLSLLALAGESADAVLPGEVAIGGDAQLAQKFRELARLLRPDLEEEWLLLRLIEIQRVLLRHRLDDYVRATHLYRPLRFVFFLSPGVWFERRRGVSRAARLRLALEELGPIFVKFGQAVSTRRDLLPADIADELAKLQDRVPPFPGAIARESIERAYARALPQVFDAFDETPLAAASIAQVHAARLPGGAEVVVKVLRPGMRAVIARDLEVLHALADLAHRYWAEGRRLRPRELVAEYHKTILDELDLMREAANASQLKRNFAASELLYVPEVHWDYCRTDVMVMERIHGVPISERSRLQAAGADIAQLAENAVRIFFTQVFRHNFFHADMHPGNLFVLVADPQRPRYAAVDFGIVGTRSEEHTSELQSLTNLVCRLLLEKKKQKKTTI